MWPRRGLDSQSCRSYVSYDSKTTLIYFLVFPPFDDSLKHDDSFEQSLIVQICRFAAKFYESLLVFRLFYSAFLTEILGKVMIMVPHDIVIELTVGMATMGAAGLIDLWQGFSLDSFLAIAQRVYINLGVSSALDQKLSEMKKQTIWLLESGEMRMKKR